MGYVDIHAHIIPGIDDGPKTLEESKQLLYAAFREGFTTIIATPHCSKGFAKYTKETVLNHCAILDQYAKEHISPNFSVLPGQEIYINESSLKMIRLEQIIPLANSAYILVEFDPDISFIQLLRSLREITMSTHLVILAHIERYTCLKDFSNLKALREQGFLMQMNYQSIIGGVFNPKSQWCRKCLKSGMIDFLATDMHNKESLHQIKTARKWLQRKLEINYLQSITSNYANSILLHKE